MNEKTLERGKGLIEWKKLEKLQGRLIADVKKEQKVKELIRCQGWANSSDIRQVWRDNRALGEKGEKYTTKHTNKYTKKLKITGP